MMMTMKAKLMVKLMAKLMMRLMVRLTCQAVVPLTSSTRPFTTAGGLPQLT